MIDDAELLRRYAEEGSQPAFAELVQRHLDFVYNAAARQTHGNAALAQDVAQIVFVDLARKAGRLSRHEVLVGWLHTATRFAVGKAIRTESRRQAREQEAHRMNEILSGRAEDLVDWTQLAPEIDAALGELKERERVAILLRFFEKRPLADIAAKLALTETAARSCVDRALDKMRDHLARRGVTSTSAALALGLANQTGAAAPVGLFSTIVSSAAVTTASGIGVGGLITFMNTSKAAVGLVLVAAAIGFGIYERGEAHRADARAIAALLERDRLQEQLLVAQKSAVLAERKKTEAEAEARSSRSVAMVPRENLFEDALARWIAKVDKLTGFLRQHPEFNFPGMETITVEDWLDVTKDPQFQSEADFRKALSVLRGQVRQKTAPAIAKAWKAALDANGGEIPTDLQTLAAYLPEGIDRAVLGYLEFNPSGMISGFNNLAAPKNAEWLLVDRPVDIWDTVAFYGKSGGVGVRALTPPGEFFVRDAIAQFTKTQGKAPTSAAELAKFAGETPIMNLAGKPATNAPRPEELEELFRAITTNP
jgi:RNA polymerase sigma factor (sigma-70 family)